MTIWVFGDSFMKHIPSQPETWVNLVSQNLNQDVKSFAKVLSTVEYTMYRFNENRSKIKENDILIISLTLLERRWFFKDRPFFHSGSKYSDKEIRSMEKYKTYLSHYSDAHLIHLTNFLHNVHLLTQKLNLHTIIFPIFFDFDTLLKKLQPDLPKLNFVTGRLGIISDYEFEAKIVETSGVEWFTKNDVRLNHLIKSNHKILANKVIENIRNKKDIILTKDIIQGVLDNRIITNPEIFKHELFNRTYT